MVRASVVVGLDHSFGNDGEVRDTQQEQQEVLV